MEIPNRQAEIDALTRKYLTDPEPEPEQNGHASKAGAGMHTDEVVIEKARAEKNGKFDRLWHGDLSDFGGDHSSGDDSFVHKLWSYTQDEEQIHRIHAMSGLSRKKSNRSDYLRRSINRASKNVTWFYEWPEEREYARSRQTKEKAQEHAGEEQPKAPSRFQRSDLAKALKEGVKPPVMLVPELLYAGRVHSVFSGAGMGKTQTAVYLTGKVLRSGGTVLYIDQENGLRIMTERAECLGITPEMAANFHHYAFPTMTLDPEVIEAFEELLDEVKPDLVIFDSWVNLLAMCGLEENSSVDIANWTEAYSQKARHRNIAVLLLDHVPKEGGSARGSGRKLDYVDVMWELRNPQKFDRETVGRIDLHLRKDREGWLPRVLTYSVGGGADGFIFKRSLGTHSTTDEAGLLPSDETTLEALKALGSMGAFDKEWREETISRGLSKATYYRSRETLLRLEFVEKVMNKFFVKFPANPMSHDVSNESHETNETTVNGDGLTRSHTPRGETHETTHTETVEVRGCPEEFPRSLCCGDPNNCDMATFPGGAG